MAVIEIKRTVNLNGTISPEYLAGPLYGGESLAHKFIISAVQGNSPVQLSGTVSGLFIREADGQTVPLVGSIEGGKATVTLLPNCYYMPGRFTLTIFVSSGGAVTAVYSANGSVRRTDTDSTIDPSGEISLSVAELVQDIADAVATIPADYSELQRDVYTINPATDYTWTLGKNITSSGATQDNPYIALSQRIPSSPGDIITRTGPNLDADGRFMAYYVSEFAGDSFVRRTELLTSAPTVTIGGTTTGVYIAFGRYGSSGTNITQSDIDTYFGARFIRQAAARADVDAAWAQTMRVFDPYSGADINDISTNSWYYVPEGTANLPTTTGGYFVETVRYASTTDLALMQNAYKYDGGARYYRRKVSGNWGTWRLYDAPAMPSRPYYYAFGDSLTYGAVWTPTETAPYYQITQAALENQMPTRIANAIGAAGTFANKGVGGAYFVGSGSNKIISAIQAQDLSSAKIITVAGGRNDSENPLGDITSTVGDGTICGAIREILDYLTTTYKKLQIVWIGVTPNTSNNANIFTRVFAGGWSLNSFDEKVSELCAEYGVPYVDWKMCTAIRHWADYSGAGNVYSHPDNEESYLQMGNYLAGRVAGYYRG